MVDAALTPARIGASDLCGQRDNDGSLRVVGYDFSSACSSLIATEALVAMRGIIVLCLGLIAAYWLDQHYYNGLYSREAGNMLHQITASFKH
jgi:hypothetical protein